MKKLLLTATILTTGYAYSQVTLFTENFNSGTAGQFTLNTNDVGSTVGGYNFWIVNNAYTGGNGTVNCFGPQAYTIANTPTQPAGITGNPTSHYLHTMSTAGQADNIFSSSFAAADGICFPTQHIFTKMTSGINTTGYTGVSLSFWWTCGGGTGKHGEVYYSTNGGTVWTQITTPISAYNNSSAWAQQTITLAAFDNVADLRFGFRFFNTANFNPVVDPGFSVDEISVAAAGCAPSASTQNPTICQGVGYYAQGATQYDSGTYYDTLTNSCGEDSVVTTNLTVTPVNVNVNATISTATAVATFATYQWINCATMTPIAGATGQTFSSVFTGSFAVMVTQNGCTDTSTCYALQGTSIDEHPAYSFSAYPNPFTDQTTIRVSGGNAGLFTVKITDAIGRTVYPGVRKEKNEIVINRTTLPSGMYFVHLLQGTQNVGLVKLLAE